MRAEKGPAHCIDIRRARPGLGCPGAWRVIRRAAAAALAAEGVEQPCAVSVLLTDDPGIRALNGQFRDMDRATDVLSFPMNELEPGRFSPEGCERDEESGLLLLGDMVLSLERTAAQAEEYGHPMQRELAYLTVHSVLHLLGYDHMDEGPMKRQMRAREEYILETLGLGRPGGEDGSKRHE